MITSSERAYIYEHAYVPEHLPHYVTAISQTEPFLIGDYVAHVTGPHMIFVGYPLRENHDEAQLLECLEGARARFKPEIVSVLASKIPAALDGYTTSPADSYYCIDVNRLVVPKKRRNMLARARQQVSVGKGRFGREHKKLIEAFLRDHRLDHATRFIFRRVEEYTKCDSALLLEARNRRGELVAFDIAEFGAQKYAFYMFNFRSRKRDVPGASDLLLSEIIARTKTEGKVYLNLGLGINPGITFFKEQWGATPFLCYVSGVQEPTEKETWDDLFDQLSQF